MIPFPEIEMLAVLRGFERDDAVVVSLVFADDACRQKPFGMQEVPVGAGDVEWMSFVATLQVIEYVGFLAVKRDAGENKLTDVANGVKFLRRFTGAIA